MTKKDVESLLHSASGVGQLGSALTSLQFAIRDFSHVPGLEQYVDQLDSLGTQMSVIANRIVDLTDVRATDLAGDKEPQEAVRKGHEN